MLVVYVLLTEWAAVFTAEQSHTRVNEHPELERVITQGVAETAKSFNNYFMHHITIDDLYHVKILSIDQAKVFHGYIGELRNMSSLERVGRANVTWIDEDTRILSFFLRLRKMEVMYYRYNQTGYDDVFARGRMTVSPDKNVIQVNCTVSRYPMPYRGHNSYAIVEKARLISVENVVTRIISVGPLLPEQRLMPKRVQDEILPTILDAVQPAIGSYLKNGLNEGFEMSGLSYFYEQYFLTNRTSNETVLNLTKTCNILEFNPHDLNLTTTKPNRNLTTTKPNRIPTTTRPNRNLTTTV